MSYGLGYRVRVRVRVRVACTVRLYSTYTVNQAAKPAISQMRSQMKIRQVVLERTFSCFLSKLFFLNTLVISMEMLDFGDERTANPLPLRRSIPISPPDSPRRVDIVPTENPVVNTANSNPQRKRRKKMRLWAKTQADENRCDMYLICGKPWEIYKHTSPSAYLCGECYRKYVLHVPLPPNSVPSTPETETTAVEPSSIGNSSSTITAIAGRQQSTQVSTSGTTSLEEFDEDTLNFMERQAIQNSRPSQPSQQNPSNPNSYLSNTLTQGSARNVLHSNNPVHGGSSSANSANVNRRGTST